MKNLEFHEMSIQENKGRLAKLVLEKEENLRSLLLAENLDDEEIIACAEYLIQLDKAVRNPEFN